MSRNRIKSEAQYREQLEEYTRVNDSFDSKLIYHVGTSAGFYSEVDAMMECMLWCYVNKVRFTIYADDANFSGMKGWREFFEPFCEENHDALNKIANWRYPNVMTKSLRSVAYTIAYSVLQRILKLKNRAKYLTAEAFKEFYPNHYQIFVRWDIFEIDGSIYSQFAKLADIALHYNERTQAEINEMISQVGLPKEYVSIQFRGGDKIIEYSKLLDVDYVLEKIEENHIQIEHLFVFSDDYRYITELREKRPQWHIYTLTRSDETGYINADFNKTDWSIKRQQMIKLFSMVEICLNSSLHIGNKQSCVNMFITSYREPGTVFSINREDI